jgi:hypothetical protein
VQKTQGREKKTPKKILVQNSEGRKPHGRQETVEKQ